MRERLSKTINEFLRDDGLVFRVLTDSAAALLIICFIIAIGSIAMLA